ncbi:MAG TPA: hypothetical protein PLD23_20510 [Armatimonadota bacterium]|nr:hypothetical protein [Armatimonadota bacterium]
MSPRGALAVLTVLLLGVSLSACGCARRGSGEGALDVRQPSTVAGKAAQPGVAPGPSAAVRRDTPLPPGGGLTKPETQPGPLLGRDEYVRPGPDAKTETDSASGEPAARPGG